MDEDWRNSFGILMCTEICNGTDAGICDGSPSTCLSYCCCFFVCFSLNLFSIFLFLHTYIHIHVFTKVILYCWMTA